MIKSIRSTLSFSLAIVELGVSIALAIKVFQADVVSENGLLGVIGESLSAVGSGGTWLAGSSYLDESITFLLAVLVFMFFSQALIVAIYRKIKEEPVKRSRLKRRQSFRYRKKRFQEDRFF